MVCITGRVLLSSVAFTPFGKRAVAVVVFKTLVSSTAAHFPVAPEFNACSVALASKSA
jgi:hypothetical protein